MYCRMSKRIRSVVQLIVDIFLSGIPWAGPTGLISMGLAGLAGVLCRIWDSWEARRRLEELLKNAEDEFMEKTERAGLSRVANWVLEFPEKEISKASETRC